MKIEKMAAIANIIGLAPAGYCAYGTWILLHTPAQPVAANGVAAVGVAPSGLPHLLVSLLVAALGVIFAAIVNAIVYIRRRGSESAPPLHPLEVVHDLHSTASAEEKRLVDEVNRMTADEMKRRIQTDPDFVRRFNLIPRNKYRGLPHFPGEPEQYVDTLEKRAFEAAREVCALIKLHGPEPTLEEGKKYCKEHNKEIVDWHWEKIAPWRTKVGAGYRAHLADKVDKIKDELAEQGLMDGELNEAIGTRLYTEADLRKIARRLRFVASHLEC